MSRHLSLNLPSIRIHQHDHVNHPTPMDRDCDNFDSANPLRSMPREIPIPRQHASPTNSRCGSFHASLASAVVPPFLSLEPPGPQLPPPSTYHPFRQPDSYGSPGARQPASFGSQAARQPASSGSQAADDASYDGLKPRKVVLHVGRDIDRARDGSWKLSPIGKPGLIDDQELSGSRDGFSMRSEDSAEKHWRESFYKKTDPSPKELVTRLLSSCAYAVESPLLRIPNNVCSCKKQAAERRLPSPAASELGAVI